MPLDFVSMLSWSFSEIFFVGRTYAPMWTHNAAVSQFLLFSLLTELHQSQRNSVVWAVAGTKAVTAGAWFCCLCAERAIHWAVAGWFRWGKRELNIWSVKMLCVSAAWLHPLNTLHSGSADVAFYCQATSMWQNTKRECGGQAAFLSELSVEKAGSMCKRLPI